MTVQLADAVTPVPILPYPSGEVPSSPLGGTVSTQDKIGTGTPNPYADLLPGGGGVASPNISPSNSNNSQSDSSQNSGGNQNNNNDSSDGDNGKLNCTPPKILNATGDACIDPAIQDTTPPVITLVGASTITLNVGDSYSDAGATALDDVDGDITAKIVTVNLVDTSKVADYTITYNVSDAAGNPAVQVSRLVHVIAPAPSLTTTTISQDTILAAGEYTYDNLIITNNAHLYLVGDPTSPNSFKGVKINAVNITIDPGAHVSADAQGYGNNQGPGASSDPYEGASYGGLSYNTTVLNAYSKTYGSALKPFDLGSGGNSAGGGAIYFNVSDTFTDNGIVSADGNSSSSGGSIYVTAKNIAGNGIFRAEGGRPSLRQWLFQKSGRRRTSRGLLSEFFFHRNCRSERRLRSLWQRRMSLAERMALSDFLMPTIIFT